MSKNIRNFYMWKFFSLNVFITPIYVLYLRELGFSYLEISSLHIYRDLTIILMELPSGILADVTRRKNVLMLSAPCLFIAMLSFVIYPTYITISIGFIFWGFAISLASGTGEAFIYENIEDKEQYPKVISNTDVIRRVGGIFTKMTGSILFSIQSAFPFICSAFMAVGSFISAATLSEKSPNKSTERENYFKVLIKNLDSIKLIISILTYALTLAIINTVFLYQQSILYDLGVPVIYFGFIYALFFLAGSFGSYFVRHLEKSISYVNTNLVVSIFLIISIVFMCLSKSLIVVISAMATQSFLHGVLFPLQSIYVNNRISNDNRSGILSLQSLIQSIFKAIILFIVGILADMHSLALSLLSISVIGVILVFIRIIESIKATKNSKIEDIK